MPFVSTDWTIDRATGNIRYTGDAHGGGSPSYATVIEFHRALQDFADDSVSAGDDELDITDPTPSDRATDNIIALINGYNIDQTAAEHLYDGSVSQAGGDDLWAGLVVVGSVPDGTELLIQSNNAFYDDDTNPYWGATSSGAALNGDANANILLRTLVPVRAGGTDIDGRRLRVMARELGDSYAEFNLTASTGNNTAAIFTATDLNNQTAAGTISGFAIANDTEGYVGLDVNGDTTNEFYYSEWDLNGQTINDLYEYTKWIQRRGTSQTLYGMGGEFFRGITHQFNVDAVSGAFTQNEVLSWSGGTGQLLAMSDLDGPTATVWIQLLTGSAPTDNTTLTGGTSSETMDVDGSVTSRTISPAFIGQSTGSAIIGAYGIGIDPADLSASDLLFDLTNSPITPPNNVAFNVNGLVTGEDYVLVGPESGGDLEVDQLGLQTTLNTDNITSVQVDAAIPTDTPTSGYIRVQDDDGFYRRLSYSSYSGDTFTIDESGSGQEDFNSVNATAGNNVFIAYIDRLAASSQESFTSVYSSDRSLFIRVRDGGGTPIRTFETTGTLGSAGGSTTVIRTSDA